MREGNIVDIRFISQDENTGNLESDWEGRGMQTLARWTGVLFFRYWILGSKEKRRGNGRIAKGESNSIWPVLQQILTVSN